MEINQASETNQYVITFASHYDSTMGNDIASNVHCEITMSNATMHNDVACYEPILLCILCYMTNSNFVMGIME